LAAVSAGHGIDDLDHRPVLAAEHSLERGAMRRAAAEVGELGVCFRMDRDGHRRAARWNDRSIRREQRRPLRVVAGPRRGGALATVWRGRTAIAVEGSAVAGATSRGLRGAGAEGAVGEGFRTAGNGAVGDRDPNLAPAGPVAEDHEERHADGGAEEKAEGQEGQLARGHAGQGPSVSNASQGVVAGGSVAATHASVNLAVVPRPSGTGGLRLHHPPIEW
jgi:hypothetical protein